MQRALTLGLSSLLSILVATQARGEDPQWLLGELRYEVGRREAMWAKREAPPHRSDLRLLLESIRSTRLREALPDVLLLVQQMQRRMDARTRVVVLDTIVAIGDERAVVALLEEVRWPQVDHGDAALLALLRLRIPVDDALALAIRAGPPQLRSSALYGAAMLAPLQHRNFVDQRLTPRDRQLMTTGPQVSAAVLELFEHPSAVVRFEALATHLVLRGGDASEVRLLLEGDPSESIQALLDNPQSLVVSSRDSLSFERAPFARSHRNGWLEARASVRHAGSYRPEEADYQAVGAWRRAGDRSLRVSATARRLRFVEPVHRLEPPLWIRQEVRNDGDQPLVIETEHRSGEPLYQLAVRRRGGPPREVTWIGATLEGCFPPRGKLEIAPGETARWYVNLVERFDPAAPGIYTLHATLEADAPELLALEVEAVARTRWSGNPTLFLLEGMRPHRDEHDAFRTELARPEFEPVATTGLDGSGSKPVSVLSEEHAQQPRSRARLATEASWTLGRDWPGHQVVAASAARVTLERGSPRIFWREGPMRESGRLDARHGVFEREWVWTESRGLRKVASDRYLARPFLREMRLIGQPGGRPVHRLAEIYRAEQRTSELVLLSGAEPEPVMPVSAPPHSGWDATMTPTGDLLVVWANWDLHEQTLQTRLRRGFGWVEDDILPTVRGRSLANPRLVHVGDELHLFATAQPRDDGMSGLYRFVRRADGCWSEPELFADRIYPELVVSPPGIEPPLVAVPSVGWLAVSAIELYEPLGDVMVATAVVTLPAMLTGWSSGLELAVTRDGPGERLLLVAGDGAVFLVQASSGLAAVVAEPASGQSRVSELELHARGGRFFATWLGSGDGRPLPVFVTGRLERVPWAQFEEVVARAHRGVPLSASAQSAIGLRRLRAALDAERAGRYQEAVGLLLTLQHDQPGRWHVPLQRLRSLQAKGLGDVPGQLRRAMAAQGAWRYESLLDLLDLAAPVRAQVSR